MDPSELEYMESIDSLDVFANPVARATWGEDDCYIFVLNSSGECVGYEEVFAKPPRQLSAEGVHIIEQLQNAELFSRLGCPPPDDYVSVGSWEAASRHCGSTERHNLFIPVMNALLLETQRKAGRTGHDWGIMCPLARDAIERMLAVHKDFLVQSDPNGKNTLDRLGMVFPCVVEDLRWILLEAEFSAFTERRFFTSQVLPVYLAGHLICGWDGEAIQEHWDQPDFHPAGKFLVL
jgi:hypothetical protein